MIMDKLTMGRQNRFMLFKFTSDIRILLIGLLLLLSASTSAIIAEKRTFEAEDAETVGGASRVPGSAASGGYLVSLTKPGQGLSGRLQIGDSLYVGGSGHDQCCR
jgi:hypothetical protein